MQARVSAARRGSGGARGRPRSPFRSHGARGARGRRRRRRDRPLPRRRPAPRRAEARLRRAGPSPRAPRPGGGVTPSASPRRAARAPASCPSRRRIAMRAPRARDRTRGRSGSCPGRGRGERRSRRVFLHRGFERVASSLLLSGRLGDLDDRWGTRIVITPSRPFKSLPRADRHDREHASPSRARSTAA